MRRGEAHNPFAEAQDKAKKKITSGSTRRILAPLAVSLGVHAAIGTVEEKPWQDITLTVQRMWEKPGMVVRPQSDADRSRTNNAIEERRRRMNAPELARYKETIRTRMESGESFSYQDLFFELERLNGVKPEKIGDAKRIARQTIELYAKDLGSELREELIRRVVTDMYGAPENYDWGQASVSEYFVTKKRNCDSIAQAELIVFEGLVSRLPPEQQKTYQLGKEKIKQHDIATLNAGKDFFKLEPPVLKLFLDQNPPGSVVIPMEILKKALVADKPITVNATKPKNGEVKDSPDIDAVTNEPVSDGIAVEGKLRGSEYVMRQAELQGHSPEPIDPDVMELTLIEKDSDDPGVEEAKRRASREKGEYPSFDHPFIIDARDYTNPSVESIRAMNWDPHKPLQISLVRFPSPAEWSREAIDAMLTTNASTIEVGWPLSLEFFDEFLKISERDSPAVRTSFRFNRLKIVNAKDIPPEQLNFLLSILGTNSRGKEIVLDLDQFSPNIKTAEVLSNGKIMGVTIAGIWPSQNVAKILRILEEGTQKIFVSYSNYSYMYQSGMGRRKYKKKNIRLNVHAAKLEELASLIMAIDDAGKDGDLELHQEIREELEERAKARGTLPAYKY